MIYLFYIGLIICFVLWIIALWQRNANIGAISGFSFMAMGIFVYMVSKGFVSGTVFAIEDNMLSSIFYIILIGLGMFILGSSMEEWFGLFNEMG